MIIIMTKHESDHHSNPHVEPCSKLQNVSLPLSHASCMENVDNQVPLGWMITTPIRRANFWFLSTRNICEENAVPRLNIVAMPSPLSFNHAIHAACPPQALYRWAILTLSTIGRLVVGVRSSLGKRHLRISQLGREHMLRAFTITPQRSP
jgi:hypothetical protein